MYVQHQVVGVYKYKQCCHVSVLNRYPPVEHKHAAYYIVCPCTCSKNSWNNIISWNSSLYARGNEITSETTLTERWGLYNVNKREREIEGESYPPTCTLPLRIAYATIPAALCIIFAWSSFAVIPASVSRIPERSILLPIPQGKLYW